MKIDLHLPLKIIIPFNFFTLFLFLFGPWNFETDNKSLVAIFVISCNLALLFGYMLNTRRYSSKIESFDCLVIQKKNLRLLRIWSYVGLLISIPDFIYTTRLFSLSLSQIIDRIIVGFTNSYENYSSSLSYVNSGSTAESLFIIINVLLYFFKFSVLPLSIVYWDKIDKKQKIICCFITALEFFKWIIKGMNKGIFDLVIILIASFLIKNSIKAINKKKKSRKEKRKTYIILGTILFGALSMFVTNFVSRNQSSKVSYYSATTHMRADPNNFILMLFPKTLTSGILGLCMYLTEGYYGLSQALKLPFEFNWFVGHNMYLITNFQKIFGINVWENTYMVRIMEISRWDSLVNWHSLYSWIANDVPFFLIPLVFFFLGCLLSSLWRDSVRYKNPYACICFVLFMIEMFYSSANNQIGALAYTSMAWFISLGMWIVTKKKYKHRYTLTLKECE